MKIAPTLRAELAKISANPATLLDHAASACQATHVGAVLGMSEILQPGCDGLATLAAAPITAARRDELLAKNAAGELVTLDLEILAYEQRTGERNRNAVRFRDGAMTSLGKSGKGAPFLRDHDQRNALARGGTVVASSTEKRGPGDFAIRQTVRLTAAWAVDLALRGLLDAVSIGWRPTGPVNCSACDAPIFSVCWHYPGDRLAEVDAGGGKKKLADAPDGPIVVEWIFTAAELIETSGVNVPGVPTARIEDVRAALASSLAASDSTLRPAVGGFGAEMLFADEPHDNGDTMKNREKLIALLGLVATASDDEILAAAEGGVTDRKELEITRRELAVTRTDAEKLAAEKRAREADEFIATALAAGKISKLDEAAFRELFELSAPRARALMDGRPVASATPVGAPRQSAADPEPRQSAGSPVITGGATRLHLALTDADQAGAERERIFTELMGNPRALHYASKLWGLRGPGIPHTLGATTISGNADLDAARVGFHAAFLTALEQKADEPIAEVYTTVPSSGNLEEWSWLGDLPGFEEWKGERKLSGLDAYKLRVTNKDWSSGLRVKANDFKDDKLGLLPPQVAGLAMKAKRHRWDMMVKLLANGFAGNVYPEVGTGLGYDGAFFFSDAHVTGSNKLTVALDAAGLSAAELKLESQTTYDGSDPMDIHGTTLIVGPKLRAQAEKLLTQERLASGEDNYHRGKYTLIVSQRLRGTADDYWFLADLSSPIKPLLFQMREEISTTAVDRPDSEAAFARNEFLFGAQARYNAAYFEHRLIVGSLVA